MPPKRLVELTMAVRSQILSSTTASTVVFSAMLISDKAVGEIVEAKGLTQVSDTGLIEKAVEKAIAANPAAVAEFKAGKQKALGALVGAVMKETGGKANPKVVNEIFLKKLGTQAS